MHIKWLADCWVQIGLMLEIIHSMFKGEAMVSFVSDATDCVLWIWRESKCACAMVTVFHSTTSTTSITSSVLLDDGTSTIRSNIEHLTLKNTHKILYPTHRPQTKFNAVRSLSQHIRIYKFLPTVWIGFGCRHLAVKWSLEMTITCFSQIWLLPFKWTMNASSQLCTTDLSASSI